SWTERTYMPLANLLNDTTSWCLGRPGQVQQINSSNLTYGTSITRTTNVAWNASYCRPTQTVAELGSGTLQVTTDIGYDSFGNVNSTTVTGVGMAARTTTSAYSDATYTTGQFPLSVTNALSQTSTISWDYNLGVPLSVTDPNGIATSSQYDVYGRRTRENRPDGSYSTYTYSFCTSGCDARVRMYAVLNSYSVGGTFVDQHIQYLDPFDRSIYEYALRMGAASYNVSTRSFDSLGRKIGE